MNTQGATPVKVPDIDFASILVTLLQKYEGDEESWQEEKDVHAQSSLDSKLYNHWNWPLLKAGLQVTRSKREKLDVQSDDPQDRAGSQTI